MSARTLLDHAAEAIGAELEILPAGGTLSRSAVSDQQAARG
jgi:hypothetical protein